MMESEYECPLLHRIIDDGYCYDINMVNSEMIKKDILKDEIDSEKAIEICKDCKYKPF